MGARRILRMETDDALYRRATSQACAASWEHSQRAKGKSAFLLHGNPMLKVLGSARLVSLREESSRAGWAGQPARNFTRYLDAWGQLEGMLRH